MPSWCRKSTLETTQIRQKNLPFDPPDSVNNIPVTICPSYPTHQNLSPGGADTTLPGVQGFNAWDMGKETQRLTNQRLVMDIEEFQSGGKKQPLQR